MYSPHYISTFQILYFCSFLHPSSSKFPHNDTLKSHFTCSSFCFPSIIPQSSFHYNHYQKATSASFIEKLENRKYSETRKQMSQHTFPLTILTYGKYGIWQYFCCDSCKHEDSQSLKLQIFSGNKAQLLLSNSLAIMCMEI